MIQFNEYNPTSQDKCPICYESGGNDWVFHDADTSRVDKKVQHIFHKTCLRNSMLRNPQVDPSCPLCMKVIDLNHFFSKEELGQFEEDRFKVKKWLADCANGNTRLTGIVCSITSMGVISLLDPSCSVWEKVIYSAIPAGFLGSLLQPDSDFGFINGIYLATATAVAAEHTSNLAYCYLVPLITTIATISFPFVYPAYYNSEGNCRILPFHFLLPFGIHYAVQHFSTP